MKLVKAHAFGNDFLLLESEQLAGVESRAGLARALCDRHRGVGADGLIVYTAGERGASMRLLNADGSRSEISGNGVRCLAAWLAHTGGVSPRTSLVIETEADPKTLTLLESDEATYVFRAAMGHPENIQRVRIPIGGAPVDAVTLRVGNPQCVVLGDVTEERLQTIAAPLAVHPHFPEGTNVELAALEAPDSVRILIWERGVGPTEASGTGACAAAVVAMTYGGAGRDVRVVSPGGSQRVEWTAEGLFLTGRAELVAELRWLKGIDA